MLFKPHHVYAHNILTQSWYLPGAVIILSCTSSNVLALSSQAHFSVSCPAPLLPPAIIKMCVAPIQRGGSSFCPFSANSVLGFCLIKWDLHSSGIFFKYFKLKSPFLSFHIGSALITNQRKDYFKVLLSSCAKNNGVSLCLPRENNFYLLHMGFSHRQFYRHLHDLSPCQLIKNKNTASLTLEYFEQQLQCTDL